LAQPLLLPFTSTVGGIFSRNLNQAGLYAPTGAYGEQATGGAIQQSNQGWIIFGITWYWYLLAAAAIWVIIWQARKVIALNQRRAAFRNF